MVDGPGRQRAREEEPLGIPTSEALELARLGFAFHAFGHDAGVQGAGQRHDALDDGRAVGEQERAHERTVDLERVDRKSVQVAQRRVPRAEVIEVDLHAELAQAVQHVRHVARVAHQGGFGDLESQGLRPDPGVLDRLLDEPHEAVLQELPGGHVDGDVVEPGGRMAALPLHELGAGLTEHPRAELVDEPQLLRDRNEIGRRDHLAVPRPSNQRLEPGAPGRGQQHDRLVVHLERVTPDGLPQLVLETQPVERARVHVGVEQLVPRLALRLGVIHRRVRVPHDLFGVLVLGPDARDADAGRREHFPAPDGEGRAEGLLNPERNGVGLRVVGEAAQQDGELVAAQPRDRVVRPQASLEPTRDRDEQFVSDEVSEVVVDDLEAVEVEIQHGEQLAAVLGEHGQPLPDLLHEDAPVDEPGQRVAGRGVADLLLGCRPLGDVGQRPREALRTPVRAWHRQGAAQAPPVGPVLVADSMLVLEDRRPSRQVRVERLLERHDIVGMDAAEPVLAAPRPGARRQADDGPPSRGHVELLGADVPRPQSVVRPFHGEREPLGDLPVSRLLCDVVPQEHRAGAVGQDIDLDDAVARLGCQDQIPDAAHVRGLHGIDERVREFRRGQGGDGARSSNSPALVRTDSRADARARRSRA